MTGCDGFIVKPFFPDKTIRQIPPKKKCKKKYYENIKFSPLIVFDSYPLEANINENRAVLKDFSGIFTLEVLGKYEKFDAIDLRHFNTIHGKNWIVYAGKCGVLFYSPQCKMGFFYPGGYIAEVSKNKIHGDQEPVNALVRLVFDLEEPISTNTVRRAIEKIAGEAETTIIVI